MRCGEGEAGALGDEGEWLGVNDELVEVGERLIPQVEEMAGKVLGGRVFLVYLRKATNTLRGIQLLCKDGLLEQAEILVRSLFELRVTCDCFVEMFREDQARAMQRVMDALMVEKIKQLKAVDYHGGKPGEEMVHREAWTQREAEISGRYSPKELGAMRRHGFTGMSVEARCRRTGHKGTYDSVYRNFSRNVHSSDFVEHVATELLDHGLFKEYVKSRNCVMLFVAHASAGWVMENVNLLIGGTMNAELDEIARKQKKLREQVHGKRG